MFERQICSNLNTMKSLFRLFFCLLLIPVTGVQGQTPKYVYEYYELIPDKFIMPEGYSATPEQRKSMVVTEDIKNKYIQIKGKGNLDWKGYTDIRLLEKTDGSVLVLTSISECMPGCDQTVFVVSYSNGQWTDVTKQYFHKPASDKIRSAYVKKYGAQDPYSEYPPTILRVGQYQPQITVEVDPGTTIKKDPMLIRYSWENGKFIQK